MLPIFEDYLFSRGFFVAAPPELRVQPSAAQAADPPADPAAEPPANSAADLPADPAADLAVEALVSLAHFARIRIVAHPELADMHMLEVAKRNIGFDVPEAFYRGFPDSVRALTPDQLFFDRLLHYFRTYGMGDFSEAGHSLFEKYCGRTAFSEKVESKDFAIITPDEAESQLDRMAQGFLASSRPLNDANYKLLKAYLETHSTMSFDRCACKDTAVRLIIDTRDPGLSSLIDLADVIRLVEWLLELRYPGASIRNLKLKNSDRKLVAAVLDRIFERGGANAKPCLEKRRAWNGLLHHLHYRPTCTEAADFCRAIRTKDQRSAYSAMERSLAKGDVRGAVDVLHDEKGPGAVLRHLDHLLSRAGVPVTDAAVDSAAKQAASEQAAGSRSMLLRLGNLLGRIGLGDLADRVSARAADVPTSAPARTADGPTVPTCAADGPAAPTPVLVVDDADVAYVLDACETNNAVILVQLLLKYGAGSHPVPGTGRRTFTFTRLGKLCIHIETDDERARRRSLLPAELDERVASWLRERLERVCRGTLGAVYVDDAMRNVALPLQEGTSMGGFGTLPRGTRIPLPEDKTVRAFTYWEKVDDIDLSCIALYDDGRMEEYSWRTMDELQSDEITFSGDQTSGFDGGSEYFDVDLAGFAEKVGPGCDYLVFCNNVFSSSTFDACICSAGYMLRDKIGSGEVFEPSTVQSSFAVNCKSRAAYLFALDMHDPAFIWLNMGEQSMRHIAGEADISILRRYLHTVDIMNLHDFACLLATRTVDDSVEADVVFSDEPSETLRLREGAELIRSRDTARILGLLNGLGRRSPSDGRAPRG